MGFALAKIAAQWGADVVLVSGPVALETPTGVQRKDVTSAAEMLAQVDQEYSTADVVIMAAAVADYTVL